MLQQARQLACTITPLQLNKFTGDKCPKHHLMFGFSEHVEAHAFGTSELQAPTIKQGYMLHSETRQY
jgi:hypothetical protein